MNGKPRKLRVITEKRKEQNRIHQERHRARKKLQAKAKSLEAFEIYDQSQNYESGQSAQEQVNQIILPEVDLNWPISSENFFDDISHDSICADSDHATLSPYIDCTNMIWPETSSFRHSMGSPPQLLSSDSSQVRSLPRGDKSSPQAYASIHHEYHLGLHPSLSNQVTVEPLATQENGDPGGDAQDDLTIYPVTTEDRASFQENAPPQTIASKHTENGIIAIDKDVTQKHSTRTNRLASSDALLPNWPTRYVADPYANHLRLHNVNLMTACLANASLLGVHVDIACETRSRTRRQFMSPFWKLKQGCGDTLKVIAEFAGISKDLRPSIEQVEQNHRLYIDLFPFPSFRQRILAVRCIQPPIFDEDELCDDINSGGLICWGTRECGSPWSMRSWEARPWFLKKWWMLTGGKNDEMYLQSKWYWDHQGLDYD